jgi:hypothetical protein
MNVKSRALEVTLSWIAMTVGAVLLTGSAFLPRGSIVFAAALGLGVALMPAGLIAIITSYASASVIERSLRIKIDEIGADLKKSLERLDSATEFLDRSHKLGVRMVYAERRQASHEFLTYVAGYMQNPALPQRQVVFVGSSLKGVIQEDPMLAEKLENILAMAVERPDSCTCHFLLTHPFYSRYREAQEDRPRTGIAKEILHAIAWIERGRHNSQNIVTKVYKGTPTCFMIATTERMIINPYPYEVEAYKCFCLEVQKTERADSIFQAFYINHYYKPWYGEEKREDHYLQPNALDYQHHDLDGPIEPLALRVLGAPDKYGDFFVIPDLGSFYLAVNIRGLSAEIPFDRKTDGSQMVMRLSKFLEVRLLNLAPGAAQLWEKVGQIELDENRNGFWHDRLDNKGLAAYSMLGVFDIENENPLVHGPDSNERIRGSALPILWKWLVPTAKEQLPR